MTLGLLVRETAMALRRLWRAPRFVAIAVLTIGAATAPSLLFSLVGRAVLPTLPFDEPENLVQFWKAGTFEGKPMRGATSYPALRYLQEHAQTLDVGIGRGAFMFLEQGGMSRPLQMSAVSSNFFDVYRIRPLVGRGFRDDENVTVFGHPVVILAEQLWRTRFGERKAVIGEKIVLSGESYTVVGVMPSVPRYFSGHISEAEAWIPAMMAPRGMRSREWRESKRIIESRGVGSWGGVGRVRPGHTLGEAKAEALALGRELNRQWPDILVDTHFQTIPMNQDAINPELVRAVDLLKVAGGLVLLLGGINLGSLFLARGLKRRASLSIHSLLGASRGALAWGTVVESLTVGAFGCLMSLALARGALLLLAFLEPSILTAPFGVTFAPKGWHGDESLVELSFILSITTALICGLFSTYRATGRLGDGLWKTGSGVLTGGLRGLRLTRPTGLLIAVEIAFALAVTLPALLLTRSLSNLVNADLGFRSDGVAMARLNLPTTHPDASISGFVDETLAGLRQTPGVTRAAWVACVPVDCAAQSSMVKREGVEGASTAAWSMVVSNGAFETLGIPLSAGRDFSADDRAETPRVAIVSKETERQLGSELLGQRIQVGGATVEVVGVVGDVPYLDLARERLPAVYVPWTQSPRAQGELVVRSTRTVEDVGAVMRGVISRLDSHLEPLTVSSLGDHVSNHLARFRGASWLLGAAAMLALFLAAIGIYGLLSTVIAQALPEIGLRLTLGATPKGIAGFVAFTALRLGFLGVIVGSALGRWGVRYLKPYLFGVAAWDAQSLFGVLIVAACLALASALGPARRAGSVDPAVVLRSA